MKSIFIFAVLLYGAAFPAPEAAGANWPRFRGENGAGVVDSVKFPAIWEASDYAWKVDIAEGNGSPVIWGNRVFILAAREGKSPPEAEDTASPANPKGKGKKKAKNPAMPKVWMPVCLSTKDGSVLWSQEFESGSFKGHKDNNPATSTPAVDAERVVFTWGTAEKLTMVAFSHAGEKLWESDLGPVNGGHGYGGSPMLLGDLVILNNDQEDEAGNLLAVNAKTGKIAWKVKRKSKRISYSIPCVFEHKGRQLLMFTNWQHGFTVIDPKDGSVVAEKSVFNLETNERAISSPVLAGNGIVIGACGFTANPKQCVAVRLNDQSGLEEVWRIERNVPHIPTVIVVGDFTYLWDDSGILSCIATKTGEEKWKARIPEIEGKVYSSPVSDGEKLFCADSSGNIHVVSASPEGLTVLGKNRLEGICRTTPAIAGNLMIVRSGERLFAVKGK